MGCADSRPVEEVFEYVHPVDPNIPVIGAKQGAKISTDSVSEVVMYKQSFQGKGGNSYILKYCDQSSFYGLTIKGKRGILKGDQMDMKDASGNLVALMIRNDVLSAKDKFKIYTPVPLYEGQESTLKYEGGIVLYLYAKVYEKVSSTTVTVMLDNQQPDEKPTYATRRDNDFTSYVYRKGRQCNYIKRGTHNSSILKINPGTDQVLMVILTAILDEMD